MRTGLLTASRVLVALGLAACASSSSGGHPTHHGSASPATLARVTIPDGATLSYPPGWIRIKADPGSASVAHLGPRGIFLGYLNLTPRQGKETLRDWPRFRAEHNADEGDRAVTTVSVRRAVSFSAGHGSCLTDRYTTSIRVRYEEIACLVVAGRHGVVVVGAAPPADWARTAPLLQRAIHSLKF